MSLLFKVTEKDGWEVYYKINTETPLSCPTSYCTVVTENEKRGQVGF